MKDEYKYKKTESWFLKGKTFSVEVKHWYINGGFRGSEYDESVLSHRWNVYVYVMAKHPFFPSLTEDESSNYPFLDELHYGCTYCEWSRDAAGEVRSKKYGSDYIHHMDERFEYCDNEKHPAAREIFFDAERLFDSFKSAETEEATA